jgi:tetratricopeptide (TPR) repeat protein
MQSIEKGLQFQMPDKESIKKFGSIIQSLGSEPSIMADRLEKVEDSAMEGSEELPSDLSELIDAASASGGESGEGSVEDFGSIDDFALDSDLRKGVTPDLLSLDDSEGGIEGFGEASDQIDLGDAELPSEDAAAHIDEPAIEEPLSGGGEAPIEDFSLPEDFAFDEPGEKAGTDEPAIGDQGEGGEDISDFTLPDDFAMEPGAQLAGGEQTGTEDASDFSLPDDFSMDTETPAPDTEGGSDFELPESIDIGSEAQEPMPEEESPGFDEQVKEEPGEAEELGSLDFTSEESVPREEISDKGGFEDAGEGFELPDSIGESFDAGEMPPEEEGMELPRDFEALGEQVAEETPSAEGTETGGEEEFAIDELGELDLPEMGDQLQSFEEEPKEDQAQVVPGQKGKAASDEEIRYTDREFTAIQEAVNSLPRNLKLKVLQVIGKSIAKGAMLKALVSLLIQGAPVLEIAALVTKITGEKIVIPKQFEKKTGLEYEEERRSFRYVFKTNIVPMLTIMIPVLLFIVLFIFIGLKAASWFEAQGHYNRGIQFITRDKKFAEGNEEFDLGYKLAPDNSWFYKYAEAFLAENQYADAQDKYEQLLGLRWKGEKVGYVSNFDTKGLLDYANMESKVLTNYKKAEALLGFLLSKDSSVKEALLARGDNYLDWADSARFKFDLASAREEKTKPETLTATEKSIDDLYESGRLAYAEYRNRFGDTIPVRFKFLRYFIRTDNLKMVEQIKDAMQANKDIKVDPLVYAELGGYLIDRKELLEVRDILSRAIDANPQVPEIHYNFARYLEIMDQKEAEEKAMKRAISLLDKSKPLTMKRILMLIDSHGKLGKLIYGEGRTQEAETELDTAIRMIESPEQQTLFGINPKFGEVYYNRGNILYDTKDFTPALDLYTKAKSELYKNPDMDYKLGYIDYRNTDNDAALLAFYDAEQGLPENINTLYAIGNTLNMKGDYFAAQGYYEHLIEVLEKTRAGISSLRPKENPIHRTLLNLIMRSYNNLGITMKKLSGQPRNPRRESEALADLTKSQEYYDLLERTVNEPGSSARDKLTKNLAYLNQRAILYPVPGYDLYIYKDLPVDPETNYIDDLFSSQNGL